MAKTKSGFVPPKGKPTGNGRETHGLKSAFAVNDLEYDDKVADKYTEGEDEVSANVHIRHVNRNLHKGETNTDDNS